MAPAACFARPPIVSVVLPVIVTLSFVGTYLRRTHEARR